MTPIPEKNDTGSSVITNDKVQAHRLLQRKKWIAAVVYVMLLSISGLPAFYFSEQTAVQIQMVYGMVISFWLFVWCKADSAQNHKKLPITAAVLLILSNVFGIAYYLLMVKRQPMGLAFSVWFLFTLVSFGIMVCGHYVIWTLLE